MSASTPAARRERISPALWFLLGAVGLLLAAGVVTVLRWRAKSLYTPPSAGDPSWPVTVWRGEATSADGAHVSVELAALHADAGRQAFETSALRRRFARSDGEPWRLRVQRAGAESAVEPLQLVAPEVRDAQGSVSRPLELPPLDGALQDPLWSLLRIPEAPLRAAQAVDVVLWGRAPGDGAFLHGLRLNERELELVLTQAQSPRADMERAFTHSTRGDELAQTGKSPAGAASQSRPRARSGSDG